MKSKIFALVSFVLLASGAQSAPVSGQGTWETTLQGRDLDGNAATLEAYYDTVLGITWLADANYARTSGFDSDGAMNWTTATGWAAGLSFSGGWGTASDWRLPSTGPVNGTAYNYGLSYNGSTDWAQNVGAPGTAYAGSTGSEMAHLFFTTLGNLAQCNPVTSTASTCSGPQAGWGLTNTGSFANIMTTYLSGTTYAPAVGNAWAFNMFNGDQAYAPKFLGNYAWAVHSGDVGAAVMPVPLPSAAWLLLAGLAGLSLCRRRGANRMKSRLLGCIAIAMLAGPLTANAVAVSAGQTLRYDFDFTTSAVTPPYGSTSFVVGWDGDLLNQSESFSLDFRDGSGSQVGTYSYTFASPGGTTGLSSIVNFSPLLTTVDGYVLMHWQAGSANVSQLLLSMRTGTNINPGSSTLLQSATFVGVVPEPGMLVLLGVGIVGLGLSRRRTLCCAITERSRHSALAGIGAGLNGRDSA